MRPVINKKRIHIFICLLVGLSTFEILLRAYYPITVYKNPHLVKFSANKLLVYELIPEIYDINKSGFRDREFTKVKPLGTYRIAIVGDSVTFGLGVESPEAYPKQLESLFLNKNTPVEVLNFGVYGYNAVQIVEQVKSIVLDYHPDLIIYGMCPNDIRIIGDWPRCELGIYDKKSNTVYKNQHRWYSDLGILNQSQIIIHFQLFIMRAERRNSIENYVSLAKKKYLKKLELPLEQLYQKSFKTLPNPHIGFFNELCYQQLGEYSVFVNSLKELQASCLTQQTKLICFVTPILDNNNHSEMYNALHQLFTALNIPEISIYQKLPRPLTQFQLNSYDTIHLNARGNYLIAKELYAYLYQHNIRK